MWCWSGGRSVSAGELNVGSRCASSSPNGHWSWPGYAYSGEDPDGFAQWREILHVIENYAASTRAPVREHTEVTEVTEVRIEDGGFVLGTAAFRGSSAARTSTGGWSGWAASRRRWTAFPDGSGLHQRLSLA
jgi:hypothetical protein